MHVPCLEGTSLSYGTSSKYKPFPGISVIGEDCLYRMNIRYT